MSERIEVRMGVQGAHRNLMRQQQDAYMVIQCLDCGRAWKVLGKEIMPIKSEIDYDAECSR